VENEKSSLVKKMKKSIIFLIKFFIIFTILQALIFLTNLSFIQNPLAELEGNLTGLDFENNQLFFEEQVFEINQNCTGLVSMSILAGIIFALRKPKLKKKFLIFIPGAILLFFVNIFRIYLVLLAGISFGVGMAELLHVISWSAMAIAIIILWYYFSKKITRVEKFNELI